MTTILRRVAMASAIVTLTGMVPAGASTSDPSWSSAATIALPSGAAGLTQGYIPALSCPSAGNCTAAGAYTDGANHTLGLLVSEVNGVWGAPQTLSPPAGANADPLMTIFSVACPRVGACSAAGSYQVANGDVQPFVASQVGATWSVARRVTLPSNAATTGQSAQVKYLSCASSGNCSAIGTYYDNNATFPRTVGFSVNEVNGTWGPGAVFQLPSGANFNPFTTVSQLECPSPGNCSAIGSYIDTNNVTRAMIANEVAGTWQRAMPVSLPGNANAYALSALSEVSCLGPGACTAIGTYANATGALQAMSVTESAGKWGRAIPMILPANAAVNPHVFFYGFNGISCASAGNCSAGGQYLDASHHYQGFLINEVAGAWETATEVTLPTGALESGKNGGVVAVSCSSAGNCSAGAAYLDAGGNYQALVINEVAGTWKSGQKITLPAGAITVGIAGGIYGLICPSVGACTATGSYVDASGAYQGFTLSTN